MSATAASLDHFYSIIPAGGVGSRLWPLSRADAPKFLHDLTGSGQSLLRDTWDRLTPLSGDQRIMVVTNRAHRAAVETELPGLEDRNVVLESQGKDSTAAICLAAAILLRREPDVIVGSFAADHVIPSARAFRHAVVEAVVAAAEGYIVTIGITPTEPATGFGYIHCGGAIDIVGAPSVMLVDNFEEKPTLATAQAYLSSGDYLWNGGMFISRADVLLEQLGKTEPHLLAGINELADAWDTPQRGAVVDKVWPKLKKIAIDYAVAEPAAKDGRLAVVPGDFDWDDVGDFASIAKLHGGGRKAHMAVLGENRRTLTPESSGLVVSQTDRLIAIIGVENIVVVDTPDVLLVTTTANAQKVKAMVEKLGHGGSTDVL